MAKTQGGHGSAPRITRKLSDAIDLLLSGEVKTMTDAAEKVGFSRQYLSTQMHKPHVTAEIERRVRKRLGSHGLIHASASLEHLSHSAVSEYVKADVSKHILSINGVKPSTDTGQAASGGFVLKLTIGGQAVEIGAAMVPTSAPAVQTLEHQPQSHGFPRVLEGEHSLTEGVRDDDGGQGGR